jgi:hypothetical protein
VIRILVHVGGATNGSFFAEMGEGSVLRASQKADNDTVDFAQTAPFCPKPVWFGLGAAWALLLRWRLWRSPWLLLFMRTPPQSGRRLH